MKKHGKVFGLVLVFLLMTVGAVVIASISGNRQKGFSKVELQDAEVVEYEQFQSYVDEGNSTEIAERLINGEFSKKLYNYAAQEDNELMDLLILDAMLYFGENGQVEKITKLRMDGYVSDQCFEDYWEEIGSLMPDNKPKTELVDFYLVHEWNMAFLRDSYSLRSIKAMRTSGMINDESHLALIEALGFDYMDDRYMEENDIAPLQDLSPEEKEAYDATWEYIDQGDCASIAEMMFYGEITPAVYHCLIKEDSELIDFVLAQAMKQYVDKGQVQYVVQLRQDGYISDRCFQYYWEMLSREGLQGESFDNGLDLYLVYELEQIYNCSEHGVSYLKELWNQGLISDEMNKKLTESLKIDSFNE